jgi:amino acid adenylation domain-containing protein
MLNLTLLHDYFDASGKRYNHKEALIVGKNRYTYNQLFNITQQLASAFIHLGLKRQERVLIYLENSAETIFSFYATLKAGGIFSIINTAVQVNKLAYILQDATPTLVVAQANKKKQVREALKIAKHKCAVIWVGNVPKNGKPPCHNEYSWEAVMQTAKDPELNMQTAIQKNRCLDIDLAALVYTSGSTGDPKGVMETHQNIIAASKSIIQYLKNTPDDIILNTLPLSFDYGLYQAIMTFMVGGTLVLEKSFIFLTNILNRIKEEKVTGFPIVPTIVAMVFKTIELGSFDISSLRYITNTGAALPTEHIKRLRKAMPHVQIYSMFGLTECKRISYLPPEYIDKKPNSVGIAMPNCEVFIVDKDNKEVPRGEVGQLVVRGANVMQGYWNAQEQTAKTYRSALGFREKLLFTGDYFKMDEEGFLYFLGRKDDMIKSRGERISAKEVERAINGIEGVNECAVIGVPDEIFGKAIKAFIACQPGVQLEAKQVLQHCVTQLESYAIPKYVDFMEVLPKTAHGKIDKKKLLLVHTQAQTQ